MPEDGEGIAGTLTKKIGPLPVWGYGLVVVGAFFVFKLLRGGSSGAAASGPTSSLGAPADTTGTDNSAADPLAGSSTSTLLTNLETAVGNLSTFQGIQQQLSAALSQRDAVNATIAKYQAAINTDKAALAKCKTAACKASNTKKISTYTGVVNTNKTTLTGLNSSIATLQSQLAALPTGSAVSSA